MGSILGALSCYLLLHRVCVCERLRGGISILTLPPAVAPQLKPCTSLNLWPAATLSPNESAFNFLCSYHNKNAGFVWTFPQLFRLTSKFEYSSLTSVTRHLAHFQHHAQHLTLSPVLLEFHQLVPNRQEHRLTSCNEPAIASHSSSTELCGEQR